jgi:Tfp pilus assembly protein PilV
MGGSISLRVNRERKLNATARQERRAMKTLREDRGVTLIETMIAVMVALIGVFSLGTLVFQATVTNKNQGAEVTRATIYAQDKIEKLLSFGGPGAINTTFANFATCTQSVASNPAVCNSSGINAPGWSTGLIANGVISPILTTCPASGVSQGYVDFLDYNGNLVTGADCSAVNTATSIGYVRMWQIADLAPTGGPAVKQVTVAVYSLAAVGQSGPTLKPVVVLTSEISNPN